MNVEDRCRKLSKGQGVSVSISASRENVCICHQDIVVSTTSAPTWAHRTCSCDAAEQHLPCHKKCCCSTQLLPASLAPQQRTITHVVDYRKERSCIILFFSSSFSDCCTRFQLPKRTYNTTTTLHCRPTVLQRHHLFSSTPCNAIPGHAGTEQW